MSKARYSRQLSKYEMNTAGYHESMKSLFTLAKTGCFYADITLLVFYPVGFIFSALSSFFEDKTYKMMLPRVF